MYNQILIAGSATGGTQAKTITKLNYSRMKGSFNIQKSINLIDHIQKMKKKII